MSKPDKKSPTNDPRANRTSTEPATTATTTPAAEAPASETTASPATTTTATGKPKRAKKVLTAEEQAAKKVAEQKRLEAKLGAMKSNTPSVKDMNTLGMEARTAQRGVDAIKLAQARAGLTSDEKSCLVDAVQLVARERDLKMQEWAAGEAARKDAGIDPIGVKPLGLESDGEGGFRLTAGNRPEE